MRSQKLPKVTYQLHDTEFFKMSSTYRIDLLEGPGPNVTFEFEDSSYKALTVPKRLLRDVSSHDAFATMDESITLELRRRELTFTAVSHVMNWLKGVCTSETPCNLPTCQTTYLNLQVLLVLEHLKIWDAKYYIQNLISRAIERDLTTQLVIDIVSVLPLEHELVLYLAEVVSKRYTNEKLSEDIVEYLCGDDEDKDLFTAILAGNGAPMTSTYLQALDTASERATAERKQAQAAAHANKLHVQAEMDQERLEWVLRQKSTREQARATRREEKEQERLRKTEREEARAMRVKARAEWHEEKRRVKAGKHRAQD